MRLLWRTPASTLVVLAVLALGIGVNRFGGAATSWPPTLVQVLGAGRDGRVEWPGDRG